MPSITPQEREFFSALKEMADQAGATAEGVFNQYGVPERERQMVRNSVRCDLAAKLLEEMNTRFMAAGEVFDFIAADLEAEPSEEEGADVDSMFKYLAEESAKPKASPEGE